MSAVATDIRLSSVLSVGAVRIGFSAEDIGEAAEQLLSPLLLKEGFSEREAAAAIEAVKQRERTGSTNCGAVALPHARLGGLVRIVGALGINPDGVLGGSTADPRLILAFASPAQSAVLHLKFLGQVAQIFRQDDIVQLLLAAQDPDSVVNVIRSRER